jgi:hypothetical protein
MRTSHWNRVYDTRRTDEVSWYEPAPAASLGLIDAAGFSPST